MSWDALSALVGQHRCENTIETASQLQPIKVILLSRKGRDVEATKGIEMRTDAYVTQQFSTRELAAKGYDMLRE